MTNELKNRLAMLRRGEVPEGYQRTKVGVFPMAWEKTKVSDCIALVERPIAMNDDAQYELVTVRRANKGIDSRGNFEGKEILVKSQYEVRKNDFVISKRQIAHGAFGVLPASLNGAIVSNEYNVFTAQKNTDIQFYNYFMQAPRHQNLFYLMSDGVHIEKMLFKTKDWQKQRISLPTLPEQQKIAAILSTQDKLIELKEKLIAEKQQQKKYLMQQLLTGKKRLPGFDGEWEYIKAKKIFNNVSDKKHHGELEVLSATQDRGIIPRSEVDIDIKYDKNSLGTYKRVNKGDFVISLRSFQGGIEYSEYEGIVSPAYTVLRSNLQVVDGFYKEYLKSPDYIQRLTVAVYGIRDGKQISYDDFGFIELWYPPLPEQQAIANILTTADREIQLLQQDLEQEKQKKKALMQLLLTGIVRV